jgi:hypothetical protein
MKTMLIAAASAISMLGSALAREAAMSPIVSPLEASPVAERRVAQFKSKLASPAAISELEALRNRIGSSALARPLCAGSGGRHPRRAASRRGPQFSLGRGTL